MLYSRKTKHKPAHGYWLSLLHAEYYPTCDVIVGRLHHNRTLYSQVHKPHTCIWLPLHAQNYPTRAANVERPARKLAIIFWRAWLIRNNQPFNTLVTKYHEQTRDGFNNKFTKTEIHAWSCIAWYDNWYYFVVRLWSIYFWNQLHIFWTKSTQNSKTRYKWER